MPLQDLLELNSSHQKKLGISEERIEAIKPALRQYIAFWREYPDLFIDFLQDGGDPTKKKELNFFFYQRVFLRVAMRYKYVYMVFPRAYSKSFLSTMVLMCRCILFPRAKLFVTSGGKEQSAQIVKEKVDEICTLVPAFARELNRERGIQGSKESKDYVRYVFKNGSFFDNVAATERSRGLRRQGGLMEEAVGIDGDILSTVIIPLMNVSRRCMDGTTQKDETLNKSQIYVTTAGYKGTFAYQKLIQLLVWMVTEPEKAFIMGGTWRVPVLTGLLDEDFVSDLRKDDTFNEVAFGREYESKWAGTSENAFFDGEAFDRNRILQKPEYEASGRNTPTIFYVIAVDVGRVRCPTVITVFKVVPQLVGESQKNLVAIYELEDMSFEDQAIKLKSLYYKYHARRIVIDGNGLGVGLLDYMTKSQNDANSNAVYPDFGIMNDEKGIYKKFRTPVTEQDAVFVIKANAEINTSAYANAQVQLSTGHLKLLIDERTAKTKLLGTRLGQKMTPEERAVYLKPYTLTSILKEELMNLYEQNEGININLKQANTAIRKDKMSSLIYGLYYIKEFEETKRRKKFNAKDWLFMN